VQLSWSLRPWLVLVFFCQQERSRLAYQYVNELVTGVASPVEVQTGADLGVALTADTEIEAGVGLVAGTLNATILVSYIIADDGTINS
jgi:hypothetical protein